MRGESFIFRYGDKFEIIHANTINDGNNGVSVCILRCMFKHSATQTPKVFDCDTKRELKLLEWIMVLSQKLQLHCNIVCSCKK